MKTAAEGIREMIEATERRQAELEKYVKESAAKVAELREKLKQLQK